MVIATIVSKPDKVDIVEKYMKVVQKRANSDEEPGTFTYRVTRRVDAHGNHLPVFIIIEEYAGAAGMLIHAEAAPLSEFLKAAKEQDLLEEAPTIDYLDEL
ncbi:hypothetical protein D9757_009211 [Collybiopsis confluens]|uniref:ABM domain-containing protein n=1 Tax=Collybiopsis confluens TaxID=2823264 RepID=A0A8H5HAG7_9AGAR|nr:hypothetical protein D9757_009211 [Collybiopsis confluens]